MSSRSILNFAVGTLVLRLQDFDNVYKPICQPTYVYIFAREQNEVKRIKNSKCTFHTICKMHSLDLALVCANKRMSI